MKNLISLIAAFILSINVYALHYPDPIFPKEWVNGIHCFLVRPHQPTDSLANGIKIVFDAARYSSSDSTTLIKEGLFYVYSCPEGNNLEIPDTIIRRASYIPYFYPGTYERDIDFGYITFRFGGVFRDGVRTHPYYKIENEGIKVERIENIKSAKIGYGTSAVGNYSYLTGLTNVDFGPLFKNCTTFPCFRSCKLLKSIHSIPSHITELPDNAFNGTNVKHLELHDSIKYIGSYALTSLTGKINVPSGLTKAGKYAFYSKNAVTFVLPDEWNEIKETLFYGARCDTLILPKNLEIIQDSAFCYLNAKSVIFPKSIKTIGKLAFYKSNAGRDWDYYFPLDSLGDYAYMNTTGNTLTFPNRKLHYGKGIFAKSTVKQIDFANATTAITDSMFADCSYISDITINGNIKSIGNYSFANSYKIKSVSIQDGVESIGNHTFTRCSNLNSLSLPSSIKHVGDYAFPGTLDIDSLSFYNIETIGEYAFAKSNIKHIIFKNSNKHIHIGPGAFSHNTSLESVTMSDGIETIPDYMFYECSNLTNVKLPNNLTSIGRRAFMKTNLSCIDFPKNVTLIQSSAFNSCHLKEVTLPPNTIELGDSAFHFNWLLDIKFNSKLKKIGSHALSFNGFQEITFPESIDSIGSDNLHACEALSSVTFPKNVKYIDGIRFCARCHNLKTMKFYMPTNIISGNDYFLEYISSNDYFFANTPHSNRVINVYIPYGSMPDYFGTPPFGYPDRRTAKLYNHDFINMIEMNPDGSTSVDDVITDNTTLRLDAAMCLPDAEGLPVTVYATDGRTLFSSAAYHGEQLPLVRNNLYIIRVNNRTAKLIP